MADIKFSESGNFHIGFTEQEESINLNPSVPGNDVAIGFDAGDNNVAVQFRQAGNDFAVGANMNANPYIIGDHVNLAGRDQPNQHPITAITGLQGALDDLEDYADTAAAGALQDAKSYADTVGANALNATELMIQAQADEDTLRYNNLRIDVNGLYSEVGVIQNDMNTMSTSIEQNAQAITLKANATDVESQFQVQAGQISSLITTTNGHTTQLTQQADRIESLAAAIEGADGQAYLELSTRITQNANAISAEATRATEAESALSSRIQTAEGIIQTVTRDPTVLNLLPGVYLTEYSRGNPRVYNGITWTVNSDGSITAKGTATATSYYYLNNNIKDSVVPVIPVEPDNYYTFSHGTTGGNWQTSYSMQVQYYDSSMTALSPNRAVASSGSSSWNVDNQAYVYVRLIIASGYSTPSDGITFYPMMERGQVAHDYQSTHNGSYAMLSRITQTADAISSEVTRATAAEASLSSRIQTADGVIQTVSSTVSNLSVGSRNLLSNSAKRHIALYGGATATFVDGVSVTAWQCTDAIRVYGSCGTYSLLGTCGDSITSIQGASYVHSIYIRNNRSSDNLIVNNHLGNSYTVRPGKTERVVINGTGNGANYLMFRFSTTSAGGSFDFTYWHPQIELGNIVSDWSPAPEDIETRVTTTESTIIQQSNLIGLVVKQSGSSGTIKAASIVTAINNAGSSVVIDADHISLQGKTIALTSQNINISSTNFSVSTAGEITAKSGTIGGWTINSAGLYKTVSLDNKTYQSGMYAPATPTSTNAAFYVWNTTDDTYPFVVRYNGQLKATDADIEGKITATSGTIAGWAVGASLSKEYVLNSGTTHRMQIGGPPAVGNTALLVRHFPTGQSSNYTNDFYVLWDGKLYANNADITGKITADSGTIGGWSIGSNTLYKNVTLSSKNYQIGMYAPGSPTSGTAAFYVQNKTDSAYPFYVTYGGHLHASDANITGTITATDGSISGSLVTSGISAGNITTGTLAAARIAAGSIVADKLASGSVTAVKIASGAITTDKLAANAVTAAKIAAGTITATQIAANTITAAQIAAGTITANEIAANAITVGKIKAGEITADRINVSSDSFRTEWLAQINQAVSVAVNENQSFRIGEWKAYGYHYSLTFHRASGGHFVRFVPGGRLVYQDGHNEEPAWGHTAYIIWYDGTNYMGLCDNGIIYQLDVRSV